MVEWMLIYNKNQQNKMSDILLKKSWCPKIISQHIKIPLINTKSAQYEAETESYPSDPPPPPPPKKKLYTAQLGKNIYFILLLSTVTSMP